MLLLLLLFDLEIKMIIMQHDLHVLKYQNTMDEFLNNVEYYKFKYITYSILNYDDIYNLILLNLHLIQLLLAQNDHNRILIMRNNTDNYNLSNYISLIVFYKFKLQQQLQHTVMLLMINYIKNKHSKSIVLCMILLLLYILLIIQLEFFQYFQAWQLKHVQTFYQVQSVLRMKNKEKIIINKQDKDEKYDFYSIWNVVQPRATCDLHLFNCINCYFNQKFYQLTLFASFFSLSITPSPIILKQGFFVFEQQVQYQISQIMVNYLQNKQSTNMFLWLDVLLLYMLFMIQWDFLQYFQVWQVKHDQTSHEVQWVSSMKNKEKISKNKNHKDEKYGFYSIQHVVQQQMTHHLQSFNYIIGYFNQNFSQIVYFTSYFESSLTLSPHTQKQKLFLFEKQVHYKTMESMINYLKNEQSTSMFLWLDVLLLCMLFMIQMNFFQYLQVWTLQQHQSWYRRYGTYHGLKIQKQRRIFFGKYDFYNEKTRIKQRLYDVCVVIGCYSRDSKGIFEKNDNVLEIQHHASDSDYDVVECKDNDFWAEKIIVLLDIQILMTFLKVVKKQEYGI